MPTPLPTVAPRLSIRGMTWAEIRGNGVSGIRTVVRRSEWPSLFGVFCLHLLWMRLWASGWSRSSLGEKCNMLILIDSWWDKNIVSCLELWQFVSGLGSLDQRIFFLHPWSPWIFLGLSGHPGYFSFISGHPGYFSSIPGHPGYFSSIPGHPGYFSNLSGHPGYFSGLSGHPGYFFLHPWSPWIFFLHPWSPWIFFKFIW